MDIIISKQVVDDLRTWFTGYVKAFNYPDPEVQQNINIKREHTERVVEEILEIGEKTGLNDFELNLAEIIALLHDIGRFEQYDRYRTFSDRKSEDHAELGIKVLNQHHVLDRIDGNFKRLIMCSIKYHNRPFLPSDETNECLFYSRLIRDADKLDIWRVVTEYYHRRNGNRNPALELELPETPEISDEVYTAMMNKQIVDIRYVKNINDIKLLQAGWIYDINFYPTFECIRKRQIMESLKNVLPKTKKIKAVFDTIGSFIEDRERTPYPGNLNH
jgi:HD superfamily phosphohydrolase YqeK